MISDSQGYFSDHLFSFSNPHHFYRGKGKGDLWSCRWKYSPHDHRYIFVRNRIQKSNRLLKGIFYDREKNKLWAKAFNLFNKIRNKTFTRNGFKVNISFWIKRPHLKDLRSLFDTDRISVIIGRGVKQIYGHPFLF